MPQEKKWAVGDYLLHSDWRENASSYSEDWNSQTLTGNGSGKLVLIVENGRCRTVNNSVMKDRYEISVTELIKLIQQHGQRV